METGFLYNFALSITTPGWNWLIRDVFSRHSVFLRAFCVLRIYMFSLSQELLACVDVMMYREQVVLVTYVPSSVPLLERVCVFVCVGGGDVIYC